MFFSTGRQCNLTLDADRFSLLDYQVCVRCHPEVVNPHLCDIFNLNSGEGSQVNVNLCAVADENPIN